MSDAPPACANHSSARASWTCRPCAKSFCEDCIRIVSEGMVKTEFCLACKGPVVPVKEPGSTSRRISRSAPAPADRPLPVSLFAELPRAFRYPLTRRGLAVIATGTVFVVLTRFLPFVGAFLSPLFVGYISAYLILILSTSAEGKGELPDWPGLTDLWTEVLRPWLLVMGTSAICFLPAGIFFLITFRGEPFSLQPALLIALVALGLLYLPMGLVAVAHFQSFSALDPRVIVRSIFRIPGKYLVACSLLLATFGIDLAVNGLISEVPVVRAVFSGLLSLYALVVEMRILGIFFTMNRARLAWR